MQVLPPINPSAVSAHGFIFFHWGNIDGKAFFSPAEVMQNFYFIFLRT